MNNLIWLLKQENQSLDILFTRLREMLSEKLEDSGFDYNIILPNASNQITINRDASRQLCLLIKEAVNNAIKHSKGTLITLKAWIEQNELMIIVSDNGSGFIAGDESSKGNGLANMHTRANLIPCKFSISSPINEGTIISIQIDLNQIRV